MPDLKHVESLLRENIRNLVPYRSARDDYDQGLLLDANENSFGSPVYNPLPLHRYPSPTHDSLRQKVAGFRGVDTENIFLGSGSDEPIDLLIRMFCKPGEDHILITPPTYGMYKVSAAVSDVSVREVMLTSSFQLQTDTILDNSGPESKILFLCSPNNPTANDLKQSDLMKLITRFPGIVVVDEAYIDFSKQESMASFVQQYPNLVVLQTFSKSFGLAGIRLGVAISNPMIISMMHRVKSPYNISMLTADIAAKAFEQKELLKFNIKKILEERSKVAEQLGNIPAVERVYPSSANFILFKVAQAKTVYQKLADRGVIIRYRGNEPLCEDCLRVSIGMPNENARFIKELTFVLANL